MKILYGFKKVNVSRFDFFYLLILFVFFIFSVFFYKKTQEDSYVYYLGFTITVLSTSLSVLFSVFFFFIEKIFNFWLKTTKYLVLLFLIPALFAPSNNLSYDIFPLERQNMILLFTVIYLVSCIFFFLKYLIEENLFNKTKVSQRFLIKMFFLISLGLLSFFVFLLTKELIPNNNFFDLVFSLILTIPIVLFFWLVVDFFTSEKEANRLGSFVIKLISFIFLLSLTYDCGSGDWLCLSGSIIFLFVSLLLSFLYALYLIVVNILNKKRSNRA